MVTTEKKFGRKSIFTQLLNDWRMLLLGIAGFCAIVLFVIPKKFFGVIYLDKKQSKVIRVLGRKPPLQSVIVINEIMYHPQSNKRKDEYIELYNTSNYRIALDGWKIRGVKFNFPQGTVIEPESYLVVAADPQNICKLYGLPPEKVVGPYSGQLSDRGEKLQLIRPDGSLEDEVAYDDGVFWDPRADGAGPSLELINPENDNSLPESWKASLTSPDTPQGTPGKQNSVFQESGSALITDVSFSPITPTSSDSIEISCEILNLDNLSSVTLFYKPSNSTRFTHIPMQENARKYLAIIPPQPDHTIIEFFIKGVLKNGSQSITPVKGESDPYVLIVDDKDYTGSTPVYRIIMSPHNYHTLTTRDIADNTPLQATFIANNQAFLGVKVRYRGQTSRHHWKKSFRIEFSPHFPFEGRSILNLNGSFWERQFTGAYLYSLAGLPTPEVKLVRLVFNGEDLQTYAQVEPVDEDFIARWFPNDTGGNLYRGVGGANLDFRGEDKEAYRPNYKKYSNKLEDDYSDIIELCRVFSYPSDENYLERLKQVIDLDEWITYFATTAVLGNQEGIYYFPHADDFFLYRIPSSKKFVIIPWDFDSICYPIIEIISQKCTKNVKRFLYHPAIRPLFYRKIRELIQETYKWENIKTRIELLKELTSVEKNYPVSAYTSIEKFLRTRINTFKDTFPEKLTARILTTFSDTIIPPYSKWEVHVGWFDPPTSWKDIESTFTWYAFPAGMGYNHKEVKSFYDFADYSSLYIRKYFTVPEKVSLNNLRLCVEYSGGFVAYLNGKEVARRFVGKSGVVPSAYERAQFFKKNAEPEMFDLVPFKHLIHRDKKNLLAVQAYSYSQDDSYFIIHPWILSGGPVPYKVIIHPDNKIKIGGTTPVLETDEVLVNNQHTEYDAVFGRWNASVTLQHGWNTFIIKSIDKEGNEIATSSLDVFYSPDPTELASNILTDAVLHKSDSPFLVTHSITVEKGSTLKIEPGCVLVFSPGTGLEIRGRLIAEGNESEPIYFTSLDRIGSWNGLKFFHSTEENLLKHCVIENASWWDPYFIGAIECVNSNLHLQDSLITDAKLVGLDCRNSSVLIDHCRFTNIYSAYDGDIIQLSGNSTISVEHSLLEKSNADAFDVSSGNLRVTKTIIRDCGDKGLSLGDNSSAVLDRVIITNCTTGIGLKDAVTTLTHTIVCECKNGIQFYYFPGKPIPKVNLQNSILWRLENPLAEIKTTESISTSYSFVQNFPIISIPGNYNPDKQFINIAERDFRLYLYSPFMKAGKDGTPLIDTSWLTQITW